MTFSDRDFDLCVALFACLFSVTSNKTDRSRGYTTSIGRRRFQTSETARPGPLGRNPHLCRPGRIVGGGGQAQRAPPARWPCRFPWRGTARSGPRPSEGDTGARRAMRACDQTAGVRPAGHGRQHSVRPKLN